MPVEREIRQLLLEAGFSSAFANAEMETWMKIKPEKTFRVDIWPDRAKKTKIVDKRTPCGGHDYSVPACVKTFTLAELKAWLIEKSQKCSTT